MLWYTSSAFYSLPLVPFILSYFLEPSVKGVLSILLLTLVDGNICQLRYSILLFQQLRSNNMHNKQARVSFL